MILIGKLEFTDKMMYPDGNSGYLFVSTSFRGIEKDPIYTYAISPYPYQRTSNLGYLMSSAYHMSIKEYLQYIVNEDIEIGRGIIKKFDDKVGVRLEGGKWIYRQTLEEMNEDRRDRKEYTDLMGERPTGYDFKTELKQIKKIRNG